MEAVFLHLQRHSATAFFANRATTFRCTLFIVTLLWLRCVLFDVIQFEISTMSFSVAADCVPVSLSAISIVKCHANVHSQF